MRRAILDTEVLVAGALTPAGAAARVVDAWVQDSFTLCCAPAQRAEVARVLQRPELRGYVDGPRAAQLLQDLERRSEPLGRIRMVERCTDPASNVLLGLAEAGRVDVLVVAEEGALRALGMHQGVRLRSAREFAVMLATR